MCHSLEHFPWVEGQPSSHRSVHSFVEKRYARDHEDADKHHTARLLYHHGWLFSSECILLDLQLTLMSFLLADTKRALTILNLLIHGRYFVLEAHDFSHSLFVIIMSKNQEPADQFRDKGKDECAADSYTSYFDLWIINASTSCDLLLFCFRHTKNKFILNFLNLLN